MRPGTDFGRILDEKLEDGRFSRASHPVPRQPIPGGTWRPGPQPVFLFGDLRSGFTSGPAPTGEASGAPTWTPVYGAGLGARARRQVPPRPTRPLTAVERQALEAIRALGVETLGDDFTQLELRSAFRALALRFHPDRHPGSTEAERGRLARSFAAACHAYRTLTSSVH